MQRKTFLTGLLGLGVLASLGAQAATETVFDQKAFDAAQAAGKPVLVAVHAPWCPVCSKQKPILSELAKDPAFSGMVMMTVDFDSQKDLLKTFGVQKQSTLIVFHGKKETARSTGETDGGKIKALLATSAT